MPLELCVFCIGLGHTGTLCTHSRVPQAVPARQAVTRVPSLGCCYPPAWPSSLQLHAGCFLGRTNGLGTCPALQLVLWLLPSHVHLQQRHRGLSGQGSDSHPCQPARDHDRNVSTAQHCPCWVARSNGDMGGRPQGSATAWGSRHSSPTLPRFSPGFSCIKNVNREIISLEESNYGAKPLLAQHAKHMEGSRHPQTQGAEAKEVMPPPQPARSPSKHATTP